MISRLLHLRLGAQHLRLQRGLLGGERVIDRRLLAGRRVQQRSARSSDSLRVLELRLELRDRGLLGLHVGLERPLLQPIQQVALLDLGAFGEQHLLRGRR